MANLQMNTRTKRFQLVYCTTVRRSVLFTSAVSGLNIVANWSRFDTPKPYTDEENKRLIPTEQCQLLFDTIVILPQQQSYQTVRVQMNVFQ